MSRPSLDILLQSLRLSSMQSSYRDILKKAQSEQWSYEYFLQILVEEEVEERRKRKIQRLLTVSALPDGKTLEMLNKNVLPQKVRAVLSELTSGSFVERAENVLIFGLPGRGKTHLAAAIGRELIVNHERSVLFTKTFSLVQKLLRAKKELQIEKELSRLDKFDVVILDDIGYVQQSREEMEILFTFLAERYERKSLIITSNLVFSKWDGIFKDPMTTAAAIDRLVHHSVILEMTGESQRKPPVKNP